MTQSPTAYDERTTLLVSSCDAFADCWPGFLHGLHQYWPDCPYRAVFITNWQGIDDERIAVHQVGDDRGWSHNLLHALAAITTPNILYAQEDYWIKGPVNTSAVEDYVRLLDQDLADYVRLNPCPPPDGPSLAADPRLGILRDQADYRTSLQMALWRVSTLRELIVPGETPWQFELEGSGRSQRFGNRFLSVRALADNQGRPLGHGIDYVCTAVVKGKWSQAALDYARAEGLRLDLTQRPVQTWWDVASQETRTGRFVARTLKAAADPLPVVQRRLDRLLGRPRKAADRHA